MKVAVAIIRDELSRILITQRPWTATHGGSWEFPGGKLEANELAHEALIREIKEEVGLEVDRYSFLGQINHSYEDKLVQLSVFQVTGFRGTPSCLAEQLSMKWMEKKDLNPEEFPKANRGIFDWI